MTAVCHSDEGGISTTVKGYTAYSLMPIAFLTNKKIKQEPDSEIQKPQIGNKVVLLHSTTKAQGFTKIK